MNVRKKLRAHSEPHTGALNDILFILLFFFLIVATLANPNVVKVANPKGDKDTKAKQTIVVSITNQQKMFIGQTEVFMNNVDTLLKQEVEKHRSVVDTPFVVINADTSAYYGGVFYIMRSAKKAGAKVVANVK